MFWGLWRAVKRAAGGARGACQWNSINTTPRVITTGVMPFFSQPQGHALAKASAPTSYDRNFHNGKTLLKVRSHNEKSLSTICTR
jgi:hypothetical protein